MPIYWLNGAKVADDYADFYDGDWDQEATGASENGVSVSIGTGTKIWTGSAEDGTEAMNAAGTSSRALGNAGGHWVMQGSPNGSDSAHGPIESNTANRTNTRGLYGLSGVFTVDADNTPPELESASVLEVASDFYLILTFGETLDVSSLPAADAFTVTVGGVEVGLSSRRFAESNLGLILGLDSPVRAGQEVLVSYEPPADNPIQDLAGNAAAGFTDFEAKNNIVEWSVTFDPSTIAEDGGVSTVTVSTGGATFEDNKSIMLTTAGTATESTDYTIGSKSLTLTAGDTEVTTTVTALADSVDDEPETVTLTAMLDADQIGETATLTITGIEPPSAPRNVAATAGTGKVRLTWDAPGSEGGGAISGYEYQRKEGSGSYGGWTTAETVTFGTNSHSAFPVDRRAPGGAARGAPDEHSLGALRGHARPLRHPGGPAYRTQAYRLVLQGPARVGRVPRPGHATRRPRAGAPVGAPLLRPLHGPHGRLMGKPVAVLPMATPGVAVDAAAVLDALTSPVVVIDADGVIVRVNGAGEELFRSSVAHLEGLALDALLPADSPLFSVIEQVRAHGTAISEYGVTLQTPRIGRHRFNVQAAALAQPSGLVVVTLHQRSIADKINRQLTHRGAARSVTAMAAMLAHEVKNPLSGIRGAAQLLEQNCSPDDRALTRLIRDEADRICAPRRSHGGVLGRRPIAPGGRSTSIRCSTGVHQLARNCFARHLRFQEDYDPSLPLVPGNHDQLVQVFLNLVKNAAEASPRDGGEIVLSTAYRHGVRFAVPGSDTRIHLPLMVSVGDNGGGIPEDIQSHLFDPFVTSKPSGRGLGLALVAKIIGDHGGVIEFDSQPRRTVFRVRLPTVAEGGADDGEAT